MMKRIQFEKMTKRLLWLATIVVLIACQGLEDATDGDASTQPDVAFTLWGTATEPLPEHDGEADWRSAIIPIEGAYRRITYEAKGDLAVMEGDMVLGTLDEIEAWSISEAEYERLQQTGDKVPLTVGIIANAYNRWPGGTVPYKFAQSFLGLKDASGKLLTDVVKAAMTEWQTKSSSEVRFVEKTTQSDYVYVEIMAGGCSGSSACSQVGKSSAGGAQLFRFESAEKVTQTVAAHELGHTLGLRHEFTRPNRDDHVRIYEDNMDTDAAPGYDAWDWAEVFVYGGTADYDDESIMNYWSFACSREDNFNVTMQSYHRLSIMGKTETQWSNWRTNVLSNVTSAVMDPVNWIVGDFNNDGTDDVIIGQRRIATIYPTLTYAYTYVLFPSPAATPKTLTGMNTGGVWAGKFNSDTKADVLVRLGNTLKYNTAIATGTTWTAMGAAIVLGEVLGTGDFNGDGLSDVVSRLGTVLQVAYSPSWSSWSTLIDLNGTLASTTPSESIRILDFDGDGLRDDILYLASNSTWLIRTSHWASGAAQFSAPQTRVGYVNMGGGVIYYPPFTRQTTAIIDWNGDSKDDILYRDTESANGVLFLCSSALASCTSNGASSFTVIRSWMPSLYYLSFGNFQYNSQTPKAKETATLGIVGPDKVTIKDGSTIKAMY